MSVQNLTTRKQILFIIGLNAIISALISVIVGLLMIRPAHVASTPASTKAPLGAAGVTTATPTGAPVIHIVKAGDTISGLAYQYDVPEADIIAANQLQNPNFLQLGMELIIPVGGLAQITPTWTPQPTPTETPIPFQPPPVNQTSTALAEAGITATSLPTIQTGETQVEISEVIEPGNADREAVVITNKGTQRIDLKGWTLNDADGNVYTFLSFVLWPGGNVMVNTRMGQDGSPTVNQLYWTKLKPIWTVGETATLKNATGTAVNTYKVK